MSDVVSSIRLTHEGAMRALQAAIEKADSMGTPVVIVVCDASGVLLAACRMDGSFFLSLDSALHKAMTAAATGKPTGEADDMIALKLAIATHGRQANGLKGGVPIIVDGHVVGGIGTGSATGDQDREISLAGAAAIDGAQG